MNNVQEDINQIHIDELQKEFDSIQESDDEKIIDFIEKYYGNLINYKTDDIVIFEDIAEMFSIYFSSLGLCNRWTDIINKRDEIIKFINKLKGKRDDYVDLYHNIDYVYSVALSEQGRNHKF